MKRTLKMLLLGLVAAGLLTGCPKGEEPTPEEPKQEEPKQEEPKQEEPKEEPPAEEPKAEVDQAMYLKAAYEVTCVNAKIEDSETQKAILAEVYPRYGFTAESFAEAEKGMAETPSVQEAIKTKMEACTPEVAAAFKTAGAEDKPAEEAKPEEGKTEKKPAAKPAAKAGKYNGTVSGGGVEGGKLEITVKDDMSAFAKFQGKREGKKFIIPMKGSIAKDGAFNLSGNKGKNNASAKGRIKDGTANGRINGSINAKGLSVTFNAKM